MRRWRAGVSCLLQFVDLLKRLHRATDVRHYCKTAARWKINPRTPTAQRMVAPCSRRTSTSRSEQHRLLGHWRRHPRKLQKRSKNNGTQRPSIQIEKGWFPCLQPDPTKSCFCERSFQRTGAGTRAAHRLCRFPRAPGGTAGTVKKLDCALVQLSSSYSSAGSSPRLDAAAAARRGVVVKPAHGALVGFSISDDAQQNATFSLQLSRACAAAGAARRCAWAGCRVATLWLAASERLTTPNNARTLRERLCVGHFSFVGHHLGRAGCLGWRVRTGLLSAPIIRGRDFSLNKLCNCSCPNGHEQFCNDTTRVWNTDTGTRATEAPVVAAWSTCTW